MQDRSLLSPADVAKYILELEGGPPEYFQEAVTDPQVMTAFEAIVTRKLREEGFKMSLTMITRRPARFDDVEKWGKEVASIILGNKPSQDFHVTD